MINLIRRITRSFHTSSETPVYDQFTGHYDHWRKRRLEAITDYYGKDFFQDKSILEVGCGHADIGAYFSRLGGKVTATDARPEHVAIAKKRYPFLNVQVADIDGAWPFSQRFDIIIHMGVLYHLKDFETSLRLACRNASDIILETEVCDSDDPHLVVEIEEEGYDQSVHRLGARPSANYIERVFDEEGMTYLRITDNRCNSTLHRYDWITTNSGKAEQGLRRFWFIKDKPNKTSS